MLTPVNSFITMETKTLKKQTNKQTNKQKKKRTKDSPECYVMFMALEEEQNLSNGMK